MPQFKIVIITPVKNEEKFIRLTIESVLNQTIKPYEWIIVDDDSTDRTYEIINEFSQKYNWIRLVKKVGIEKNRIGGAKVVQAFNFGYKNIRTKDFDFIVKLDGDLILPANYFELVLNEFNKDKVLGICGGSILNKDGEKLIEEKVNSTHVRGALKMIRKECWYQIGGFKETWYWDGIDIIEANYYGWKTKSIQVDVVHLRPTSQAYNIKEHTFKSGYESYRIGLGLIFIIFKSLNLLRQRPYFIKSYLFLKGYLYALIKKEKNLLSKDISIYANRFKIKSFINSFFRVH